MKRTITFFVLLLMGSVLYAQCPGNAAGVYYRLDWNASSSQYEFYVVRCPSAAPPVTVAGTSTVTIVFPNDPSDTRTVSHTSESVSNYNAAGEVRGPSAAPGLDYYVFNSTGGSSLIGVLNDGAEVLWMTFAPSDGNDQARLFINGGDPGPGEPGMNGIDGTQAFNIITTAGVANEYNGILNLEEEQALTDITIYPNPASDTIYLEGLQDAISSIEVFSITGQRVTTLTTNFSTIDVSYLENGVYFLKVTAKAQQKILRFIKE
jgi:hypothetical protein